MARAGHPVPGTLPVRAEETRIELPQRTGHLTLRNVGVNMVWLSWTGEPLSWFEIAVGTSYECDQDVHEFFVRTQTGKSLLAMNAVPWN